MTTRICAHCKKPMGNSLHKEDGILVHVKCIEEYNICYQMGDMADFVKNQEVSNSEVKDGKNFIRGKIEINYGADNFCYVWTKNGRRIDLTEWMDKFNGKDVEIDVFTLLKNTEVKQ